MVEVFFHRPFFMDGAQLNNQIYIMLFDIFDFNVVYLSMEIGTLNNHSPAYPAYLPAG